MRIENKKIILSISILFLALSSFGQKIKTDLEINCIKKDLLNYFIEIERIDDNSNFTVDNIGVSELLDKKNLGYHKNGVYRFFDYSSHKIEFLLLVDETQYKILTLYDIESDIRSLINFLSANFTIEKQIEYIKLAMIEFEKNILLKRSDDLIPKDQKWNSSWCNRSR